MKREMDILRDLMLILEALPIRAGGMVSIPYDDQIFTVSGYSEEQIIYHLRQLVESGFIDSANAQSMSMGGFSFQGLTPSGHDFLDSVRDSEIWNKTKEGASAAGGFSLDLLKDLAKGFVKQQIKKHTGIDV